MDVGKHYRGRDLPESSTARIPIKTELDLSQGFSSLKMHFDGIPFVPERGFYQPSTEQTWEAYEALLSIMAEYSRESPPIVVCSLANEVLSVLKSPNVTNLIDKKTEIQKLLCPTVPISYDLFGQIVLIGNNMTDYPFGEDQQPSNRNDPDSEIYPHDKEFYQPKTERTLVMYQMLLNVVENQLGSQPYEVACYVANEVLSIMKNKNIINEFIKKDSLGKLLNWISEETFKLLLYIEGGITDYERCMEDDPSVISKKRSAWAEEDKVVLCMYKKQKSDIESDFVEKCTLFEAENKTFEFESEDEDEDEVELQDGVNKLEEKCDISSEFNGKFTLSQFDESLNLKLVDYENKKEEKYEVKVEDNVMDEEEKGRLIEEISELTLSDIEDSLNLHLVNYDDDVNEGYVEAKDDQDKNNSKKNSDDEWILI